MGEAFRAVMRYVDHMGPKSWLVMLVIVIAVGLVTLRGFGSRSGY